MTKRAGSVPEGHHGYAHAALFSVWGSVILFLISAVIGIAVDSITLILDAAASLVILASGLLMHFSARKIHQPPNEHYHYGYHKYEPLTALVQRVLIIATCVISIHFAAQDILHAEDIHSYSLPAAATFFAAVLGFVIMGYLGKIARRTHSRMFRAASMHWMSDAVLSLGVCFGFVAGWFLQRAGYAGTPYVDPVMAIVLALILMGIPLKGFPRDLVELLDAAPSEEIRRKIREVVERHREETLGVERLRARAAGQKIFADICFRAREDLTLAQAEALASSVERDLKTHFPGCDAIISFASHKNGTPAATGPAR
jgi:cation diffusion facilitator family transporter